MRRIADYYVPMPDEEKNANGAESSASDLQLSEGKSLSFLATNVAGAIDLGGLPPANGAPDGSTNDAPTPEGSPDTPAAPEPAPSDTE
jgi:hypothetical protein